MVICLNLHLWSFEQSQAHIATQLLLKYRKLVLVDTARAATKIGSAGTEEEGRDGCPSSETHISLSLKYQEYQRHRKHHAAIILSCVLQSTLFCQGAQFRLHSIPANYPQSNGSTFRGHPLL